MSCGARGCALTCPAVCLRSALREESPPPPLEVGAGHFLLCRGAAVSPVAARPAGAAGGAQYVRLYPTPTRPRCLLHSCL